MYISKIELERIRSILDFRMEFQDGQEAGWHVLIGDNGSGKSSILRAISLGLIGPSEANSLRVPLVDWIHQGEDDSRIFLRVTRGEDDKYAGTSRPLKRPFNASFKIVRDQDYLDKARISKTKNTPNPENYIWSGRPGWFSAAFGPFRRFTGGNKEWEKVYYSNPRSGAHLSVFGEDVALTECVEWLSKLKFESIEETESQSPAGLILAGLEVLMNNAKLLPHGTKLHDVTSQGVFFQDGNKKIIEVSDLSDGFRSLLSMIFELIRQMILNYGEERVFKNVLDTKNPEIDIEGVVLIDEVDAHLHPTWQTRIGQWFTSIFPKIQFIVTTHSPLVCRASKNGTIWRLPSPGDAAKSVQLLGDEKNLLIYGNVLDAYGTNIFGKGISIDTQSSDLQNELAELNIRSMLGEITKEEVTRREQLLKLFPSQQND
jgi:energy-coupling factor transporter ATP-binding protein EcfA2